uniref:Extracellular matrix protein FRAS1 n=1 Tax=Globodera pallida TaxID=36090 RepID=A0A183CHE2_GLOPA
MQQQQLNECAKAYQECKPCGWANCIPDAGTAATACCAANYAFKCCTEKPPQTTPRQLEELEDCEKARKKCPYRMSSCIAKRGQAAGACCSQNQLFTCLEPSIVWDKKTALELLQDFQTNKECKAKSFCVCEGPYFPQNRGRFVGNVPHRLIGTCCDNSSACQCCWTDKAIVKLPTLHKVAKTKECKAMIVEEEKCNCAHAHHPYYPNLVPHSCVKEEVWSASPCCKDGFRIECCAYPEMDLQSHVARVLCDANDPKSDDCTAIGYYAAAGFDCEHAPEINSICFFNFLVARNVDKPIAISQKPVLTLCKGRAKECPCGHASCVFTGLLAASIDACCDGLYEFKCCANATALTTTTAHPKGIFEKGKCEDSTEIKRICKTCDFYSCIRREGYASSICCAEHYVMTCCVGEQVPTSATKSTMQTTMSKEVTTTMAKTTTMTKMSTNPMTKITTTTTVEDPIYAERKAAGPPMQCLIKAICTMEMQRRASHLYEQLTDRRANLVQRLNDGVQLIVLMQSQLISERLLDWKNSQKLSQIGVVFEQREQILDEIQSEFEVLAENNWTLRACACWQLDLLKRSPRLSDSQSVQSHISNLTYILETLTKLLVQNCKNCCTDYCRPVQCMLVTQSFVVAVQPEPVLKTQHKFVAEVRLLIGERLGIKQQLINTNVTVKIIAEEEAKMLSTGQLNEKDIKTVGSISNDFEKLVLDERGHMAAKFNNSKLSRIAHRKPPAKGSLQASQCAQTATDQKYALLFHITPFQLGNLGKFDVWTLSLPIMDCDAQAVILWQRAFSSVVSDHSRQIPDNSLPDSQNRTNASDDVSMVAWPDLSRVLRHKFFLFTGANRPLSESDLAYLGEKLGMHSHGDNKPITFQRFAKQNLRDDVNFSFWEWFFLIMQLIKQKLLKFWDEGWLVGFISKQDTSSQMMMCPNLTFLLRFSDTQTGAVSIGFVCEEDGIKVPFHLAPFTIKDLDQLSLASRIRNCPQLQEIRYLHPDIEKEEMLAYFESEEQRLRVNETSPTGYIGSEIVMVAKTAGCKLNSALGSDSPSPMSNQWSPGELQQSNSMEISDDIVSILSQNQLEAANVESLLGFQVGHRMAVDQQQPMPHLDLSFMDSFAVQPNAAQCDVLDQLTKRGQALLVDARMEGIEIRQCTCPEQTECIDEMQMQAIDCVKSCWTTFSAITDQPQKLRTCFVRADVLIDEFVKCFENTVESCLQQREEKMINKVNITEMFRLGIERIEKTKAQLLKSLADGPIKKIMDTTSKFGVCVKDCFLAKNPNQYCFDEKDCQPLLVGAKATKSLRKCTKRIDWKKESGELCECSVKAGIADMEQYW